MLAQFEPSSTSEHSHYKKVEGCFVAAVVFLFVYFFLTITVIAVNRKGGWGLTDWLLFSVYNSGTALFDLDF